eukprot:CAMPEP_0177155422 /NCGR_PEP_ID=MMETSP0367-20130122/2165_1 /TAXON_ID=447022 ORGANISM="Scrippsiella hangoei-like, Strain SHHI-4" /NCGR_SAMPLE_ID=MMETSP0367 /ASSEMBLY_ACC=CAM_ASM_000362 /LENGTH=295 /DNA_ID=CAMNT_0018600769 /DNA_START=58 /DNA_END=945 /DNA_ORIENTATION=-
MTYVPGQILSRSANCIAQPLAPASPTDSSGRGLAPPGMAGLPVLLGHSQQSQPQLQLPLKNNRSRKGRGEGNSVNAPMGSPAGLAEFGQGCGEDMSVASMFLQFQSAFLQGAEVAGGFLPEDGGFLPPPGFEEFVQALPPQSEPSSATVTPTCAASAALGLLDTSAWSAEKTKMKPFSSPLAPPVAPPMTKLAKTAQPACNLKPPRASVAGKVADGSLASLGSANHAQRKCKPCAFMHKDGCASGSQCRFCHLCPLGEKKTRTKERKDRWQTARQVRAERQDQQLQQQQQQQHQQ